jgi:RNA polymerase sigma-70 factor (ECF subfamily)
MTELTDTDLVKACSTGDRAAFRLLIHRHEKPLFNAAYRITSNREDALDALQQAFLKVHLNLGTFDRSRRFFSWIFKIVVNESLNLVERRKRHAGEDEALERVTATSDPEKDLESSERDAMIQGTLIELKPTHRVVIVLRHFNHLSYQEIANITEVPEKTVKSRLFSARQALRKKLQEKGLVGHRLGR